MYKIMAYDDYMIFCAKSNIETFNDALIELSELEKNDSHYSYSIQLQ